MFAQELVYGFEITLPPSGSQFSYGPLTLLSFVIGKIHKTVADRRIEECPSSLVALTKLRTIFVEVYGFLNPFECNAWISSELLLHLVH